MFSFKNLARKGLSHMGGMVCVSSVHGNYLASSWKMKA